MDEAKTNRSKRVDDAERSESAAPPIPPKLGDGFASLAGSWRGQVRMGDDFDELPADLAEALGNCP
jgi:hypothetical protein